MADHLATAFGVEIQRAELLDPGLVTLVAEASGTLAGYVQLRQAPCPVDGMPTASVEIWRFYVARGWHGQGLAPLLMKSARLAARELCARIIWLGVWENNARAISFYQREGFLRAGAQSFFVGADEQRDWIMSWTVPG